jgi:hypothetical protein
MRGRVDLLQLADRHLQCLVGQGTWAGPFRFVLDRTRPQIVLKRLGPSAVG